MQFFTFFIFSPFLNKYFGLVSNLVSRPRLETSRVSSRDFRLVSGPIEKARKPLLGQQQERPIYTGRRLRVAGESKHSFHDYDWTTIYISKVLKCESPSAKRTQRSQERDRRLRSLQGMLDFGRPSNGRTIDEQLRLYLFLFSLFKSILRCERTTIDWNRWKYVLYRPLAFRFLNGIAWNHCRFNDVRCGLKQNFVCEYLFEKREKGRK